MLKKTQPKNDVLQEEIVFSDTDDEEERYSMYQLILLIYSIRSVTTYQIVKLVNL